MSDDFEGEGGISLRMGKAAHYKNVCPAFLGISNPAHSAAAERRSPLAERYCQALKFRLLLATPRKRYCGKNLCRRTILLIAFM